MYISLIMIYTDSLIWKFIICIRVKVIVIVCTNELDEMKIILLKRFSIFKLQIF